MTESCKRFEQIINNYRNGEYGKGSMYLSEIMQKAGEPNLLKQMNETELKYLRDNGFISRMMYSYALEALKEREEEFFVLDYTSGPSEPLKAVDSGCYSNYYNNYVTCSIVTYNKIEYAKAG